MGDISVIDDHHGFQSVMRVLSDTALSVGRDQTDAALRSQETETS